MSHKQIIKYCKCDTIELEDIDGVWYCLNCEREIDPDRFSYYAEMEAESYIEGSQDY